MAHWKVSPNCTLVHVRFCVYLWRPQRCRERLQRPSKGRKQDMGTNCCRGKAQSMENSITDSSSLHASIRPYKQYVHCQKKEPIENNIVGNCGIRNQLQDNQELANSEIKFIIQTWKLLTRDEITKKGNMKGVLEWMFCCMFYKISKHLSSLLSFTMAVLSVAAHTRIILSATETAPVLRGGMAAAGWVDGAVLMKSLQLG